ncbi:sel1 repeat family protein [Aquisalinus flavus]|uniref:Sel1 repeat family protein n=1 Tax=Aquisalinus flavus TaxID=1526572 RepID=A0A8J2V4A1_9PROT|nr:sel1 repeat family protein [Aquisalinus flavus]MBD0427939.1 sel1 repeat family protein [Aquisalinus flavus]UNE47696.1 sel1 repeat family protein [Aquisalinus flavus]GGD05133.1 hypothetical protein GCM10011342_12570 [Aquisalinus flavus]
MSISITPNILQGAEKLLSADDMYRLGLEASTPGAADYDIVKAHKWFNLSAMKGNADARLYRKELLLEMTSDQVADAQRMAREWLSNRQGAMSL